ncbi:hypothetical protein [Streptomyces sp. NPDC047024]|uniref:hypothetical protein n=1 Tax=Streptomyces sp. NPDC047024 TaxID=3155476 RepID=UPI0033CBDC6D
MSVRRPVASLPARLLAAVPAPLDPATADAPQLLPSPGGRLLVQRGDTEVAAVDLLPRPGRPREVRFPAPWTRAYGSVTVSPGRELAVFAGPHAVRAVEPTGATRWEVRHGCWAGCPEAHGSFEEYADDEDHFYADSGSAAFNVDGTLVWVHVPGPLGGSREDEECWAVLDASDGRVLGQVVTGTVASASVHTPHPDPARMILSVGEGEEGSPVLYGRWDGRRLAVERIGDERVLAAVSPSGERLVTVPVGQWSLSLHQTADASHTQTGKKLDALDVLPPHPNVRSGQHPRPYWDFDATFLTDDTLLAGTSESDTPHGPPRHWLVDTPGMTLRGEISYPLPVSGPPRPAGDGTWSTLANDRTTTHLWGLESRPLP